MFLVFKKIKINKEREREKGWMRVCEESCLRATDSASPLLSLPGSSLSPAEVCLRKCAFWIFPVPGSTPVSVSHRLCDLEEVTEPPGEP